MKLVGEILVDKQPSPRSYKLMKYNAYLENIKMLVARTLQKPAGILFKQSNATMFLQ